MISCGNERRAVDTLLHPSVLLASSFRRSSGKFDTARHVYCFNTHFRIQRISVVKRAVLGVPIGVIQEMRP